MVGVVTLDFSKYPIPTQAFIGGKYVDCKDTGKHELRSSVNDQVLTSNLQWATSEDVDTAVDAAQSGLVAWSKVTNTQKRDIMVKFANLIREHAAQIAWLEAMLVGKDSRIGNFGINEVVELFIYYGNIIHQFHGQVQTPHDDGTLEYVIRQPFGVVAGITPFNEPLLTFAMKVAPAIAAGNAIVLKASEQNPLSTLFLAGLTREAGFPDGVINVLTGGVEAGSALATHMKIRMISFTGSIQVGKLVQQAAAKSNLKKVTLELGGKSPVIVFPDADLERASKMAAAFLALNGQGCLLGTRMYVHEDVAQEMTARMKGIAEHMAATLGSDPLDPTTVTSPLFNHRQKEVVMKFIQEGKTEATLLTGGSAVGEKGCYVQPTIFINPSKSAKVLKEEVFGPVLTIVTFKDEQEVLDMANDTEYGLAAYVHTKDLGRALRFTKNLEAGMVSVNSAMAYDRTRPFGGWKQSGQGYENGVAGLEDWSQTKSVLLSI
ncbi:putative aldehyde dehydrogenase-like [Rosellinia necatrix]|uniref:aldehyde dehydrogenase (NAD(+)) n=1 Tax=Rosellinia necatrix TaxID=77044 RepID=A0A1W2TDN2_ROSNE|nr:putative aldehyde dehydrogenase-like [Rosellinia necatrix]